MHPKALLESDALEILLVEYRLQLTHLVAIA
jgi:hypothetical protein